MPLLFPTQGTLSEAFSPRLPFGQAAPEQQHASEVPSDHYSAWSTVEDVKSKAGSLSEEARRELNQATQTIQPKRTEIELYSPKYYATCTLGGLVACVGFLALERSAEQLTGDRA